MDALHHGETVLGQRDTVPAVDYQQVGPTVPRMILGTRLRQLREASGITGADAGLRIRASHSKISRLEMGRTGFKIRDVRDLLALYGITDEAETATLLALARQSNAPGWWHVFHEVVPSWLNVFLGLEQTAVIIRGYELQFVPGLMQTEEYARALMLLGPADTADRIEQRLALRMGRQRILDRVHPPQLWVVIDEAALRRSMGAAPLMRRQLDHLLQLAELPHVSIQVVPFTVGGHAAIAGPVTVLCPPGADLPDVVYLDHPTGGVYPDKPAEIERYRHIMNRLVIEALPPTASRDFLYRVRRDT